MSTAVDVYVTGRVQGVCFRMYAEREAARLGVTGWVRNEPDGAVTAYLEGEEKAVDAMVSWFRRGPDLARVEHVRVTSAEIAGATSFRVRY